MGLPTTVAAFLCSALVLCSCANRSWTEKHAAALPSMQVGHPTKSATAYRKPFKISEEAQKAANSTAFATGLAGGLIGGAVGGLIIGGVMAADQKSFESRHADQITRIESTLDHRIESSYTEQLERELRRQPFFAKRLDKKSPHALATEVASYGLMRHGSDDPMKFAAAVGCTANLTGRDDEVLLKNVAVIGRSGTVATLAEFAGDKKLLDRAFREAAAGAATALGHELEQRTEDLEP